jgi:hypothetical protein
VPLASAWTNIDLSYIHQNVQNIPFTHGITYSSQNNFIVNNLTNASWGAATYLSQSLYGVCTNRYCSRDGTRLTTADGPNMQKVQNNGYFNFLGEGALQTAPRFLTGCGPTGTATAPLDITHTNCAGREWHTEIGMLASSNHNPTGIFDLAGGVWEYTFSARANPGDTTTFTNWRNSGLNAGNFNFHRFSDLFYFFADFENCMACADWQTIKHGSLAGLPRYFGLALAETIAQDTNPWSDWFDGWGGDSSFAPSWSQPWFVRGGESGLTIASGIFAFNSIQNTLNATRGWRAIMAGS